jgi:hypothetical protein
VKTCARETLTIAGFSLDGKRDRLYVGAAKATTSSLTARSTMASTRPRPPNCARHYSPKPRWPRFANRSGHSIF